MGRFANTWRLTKNSWSLLKQDRELLWLPVLSMLTILAIVAAAAVVGFVTGSFDASGGAESVEGSAVVLGLVFAFVATATVVYFEGALVAGAHERMTGGDPTVRSAMSKAASRLPSLLGWALITMTVGLDRPCADGKYELIAGERRCRAARQAGLDRIPAVVRTAEDADTLEQALLENLHREDLNAIEEAAACQQLIEEFGFTQETVAKRLGRSRSAVANTVRLLQLPDEVKAMVVGGSLSAGHARALLGVSNEKSLIKLAKKAVSDGLTVRTVEQEARGVASPVKKPKQLSQRPSGADRGAAVLELESLLSDHLDTKVDVTLGKGQGKLVIKFADLDDLERIYRVMLQA